MSDSESDHSEVSDSESFSFSHDEDDDHSEDSAEEKEKLDYQREDEREEEREAEREEKREEETTRRDERFFFTKEYECKWKLQEDIKQLVNLTVPPPFLLRSPNPVNSSSYKMLLSPWPTSQTVLFRVSCSQFSARIQEI